MVLLQFYYKSLYTENLNNISYLSLFLGISIKFWMALVSWLMGWLMGELFVVLHFWGIGRGPDGF
ncbi:MAG: hypothetical protein BJG00_011710 [Limnothrix sp. CACIAM 69d]|nr:MAG: hypothetical protein BJG00_011710 [Limnothrix sp. CACIAM 69d]